MNNKFVGATRLSNDYLTVVGGVIMMTKPALEALVVFRHPADNTLWAIASHLTGWEPNPLVLLRAHIADGNPHGKPCGRGCTLSPSVKWEKLGNPTDTYNSYNQQPTFIMNVLDKNNRPFLVLMSDNWLHAGPRGLPDAGYVWLPIDFRSDGTVALPKLANWSLSDPFRSVNEISARVSDQGSRRI